MSEFDWQLVFRAADACRREQGGTIPEGWCLLLPEFTHEAIMEMAEDMFPEQDVYHAQVTLPQFTRLYRTPAEPPKKAAPSPQPVGAGWVPHGQTPFAEVIASAKDAREYSRWLPISEQRLTQQFSQQTTRIWLVTGKVDHILPKADSWVRQYCNIIRTQEDIRGRRWTAGDLIYYFGPSWDLNLIQFLIWADVNPLYLPVHMEHEHRRCYCTDCLINRSDEDIRRLPEHWHADIFRYRNRNVYGQHSTYKERPRQGGKTTGRLSIKDPNQQTLPSGFFPIRGAHSHLVLIDEMKAMSHNDFRALMEELGKAERKKAKVARKLIDPTM